MSKRMSISLFVLLFIVPITGFIFLLYYNSLVSMDEGVKSAFSNIDTLLQKRNDLIPNLVETVKGYAGHEKEIFERIADAGSRLAGAKTIPDKIATANEFSSVLSRLLMVVENYPNLKADATFIKLMDELQNIENQISRYRQIYNDKVKKYNVSIRQFPESLIASMFHFGEAKYFEAPESAKEVPKVQF